MGSDTKITEPITESSTNPGAEPSTDPGAEPSIEPITEPGAEAMAPAIKTKKPNIKIRQLSIDGMTCVNCQSRIERKLNKIEGVEKAEVHYDKGTAVVTYDSAIVQIESIIAAIEELNYQVAKENEKRKSNFIRVTVIFGIIVALYIILQHFGILNLLVPSQLADSKMGYGMLFVIGLITSIHCISMCGGINLSQSIPREDEAAKAKSRFATFWPPFLYNLGRVISYTAVGFVLGFVGLLLGSGTEVGLSVLLQGVLKLIAGVFMVILGIVMLGLFPQLRKLVPRMPKFLARKTTGEKKRRKGPLIVGLLNGFMPCGPLQSIQIVALASGSPLVGAISMFLFSVGTVPLMLGLGSLVSALGKKFTYLVINVGSTLVIVLGLAMLSQGAGLTGMIPSSYLTQAILALVAIGIVASIPFNKTSHAVASTVAALGLVAVALVSWNIWGPPPGSYSNDPPSSSIVGDTEQVVNSTLLPNKYPHITVQVGVPVKWIIDAPAGSINGCNNRFIIPEYDIEYTFQPGENIIEFTPEKEGVFEYSCWMGMIYGTITVIGE